MIYVEHCRPPISAIAIHRGRIPHAIVVIVAGYLQEISIKKWSWPEDAVQYNIVVIVHVKIYTNAEDITHTPPPSKVSKQLYTCIRPLHLFAPVDYKHPGSEFQNYEFKDIKLLEFIKHKHHVICRQINYIEQVRLYYFLNFDLYIFVSQIKQVYNVYYTHLYNIQLYDSIDFFYKTLLTILYQRYFMVTELSSLYI